MFACLYTHQESANVFESNVDRLFAMWQAIYPTSYVNTTVATGTTFTIAAGDVVDADSRALP